MERGKAKGERLDMSPAGAQDPSEAICLGATVHLLRLLLVRC